MARIIDKDEKRASIALSAIKLFCEKGRQQKGEKYHTKD